jgi:hypothetical protein
VCRLALSRDLSGHEVKTARQMGWTAIGNGELLALASQEFDVFVTVDRNLAFQQNFGVLTIAVVVLQAPTNRLADLKPLVHTFWRRSLLRPLDR